MARTVQIPDAAKRKLDRLYAEAVKAGGWRGVGLARDVPLNLGTMMAEAVDALEARMREASKGRSS